MGEGVARVVVDLLAWRAEEGLELVRVVLADGDASFASVGRVVGEVPVGGLA